MSKLVLENNCIVPNNWKLTNVEELLKKLESGSRPKGGVQSIKNGIPSIGGEHLNNNGDFRFEKIKFIPKEFYNSMTTGHIQKNDILIVKDGATTGRTSFISMNFPYEKSAVNEHVFIVRTFENFISPKFLFYFFCSPYGQQIIKSRITGTAQGGINTSFVKKFPILIPPTNEQKRIVKKIEELFSVLTTIKHIFPSTLEKLDNYHQSLFNDAFSGILTKNWRTTHPEKKSNEILNSIIEDRKKYDSKFSEFKTKELELKELPISWTWTCLGNYGKCMRGKFSVRPRNDPRYYEGVHPFIQIGDLPRKGGLITTHNQTLNDKGLNVSRKFDKGTVVIAIVGATIANTGILDYDMCFPDSLIGINTPSFIGNKFIEYYLRFKKNSIRNNAYASGGQPNINLDTLNYLLIPIPPLKEQEKIVKTLDEHFSNIDSLRNDVLKLEEIIVSLFSGILKYAFEGKLVPQDPSDEPVEILLQKIKQEKEQLKQKEKSKKRKKNGR